MSWGVAGGPSRWTWLVLDAKGTYLGSGRVITPCAQTLQSLGTVTGACHQEIQCRLHNPDIQSRVMYLCYVVMHLSNYNDYEHNWLIFIIWTAWFLLFKLAYPSCLCCPICMFSPLQWSPYNWCEQRKNQMKTLPSWTGADPWLGIFSSRSSSCLVLKFLGCISYLFPV